jgi:hypothetical protein
MISPTPGPQQLPVGQGLQIIEDSLSHSFNTPHSVGLLSTSDFSVFRITLRPSFHYQVYRLPTERQSRSECRGGGNEVCLLEIKAGRLIRGQSLM